MLDHRERADDPTQPGTRPPDLDLPDRDGLKQRLERLAGLHPSAPDYRAAERHGPERQRAGRLADSPSATERRASEHVRPGRIDPADGPGPEENRGQPERHRTGWDAPEVRDHPGRPDVTEIRLPDERGRHILDGDGPGSPGGGHRHGTGRSGKTEFPSTWPDDVILPTVEEITRTPHSVERQRNGRWLATGERDGVTVTTIVLPDGRIWTAWPEPGNPGVRQNPKEGDA